MSYPVIFNQTATTAYANLDQGGRIMATYIWVGGSGQDIRNKTRSLEKKPTSPSELPDWNFDGSSTGQAPGDDSEVILKPRAIFRDPFNGGDNILVMCDCYEPNGTPIPTNTRKHCAEVMESAKDLKPWFGLEQEYTLYRNGRPLGFPEFGFPPAQGPYYCGVGADRSHGRAIVEAHYKCCLYAGVTISGTNAEVMPGQWEYQVGPCTGIDSGDHTWISRYLLHRVCEDFGVVCSFAPKPMDGDWNGAGCHCNFSTEPMRNDGGWDHIMSAVEKLKEAHHEHIAVYGEGNDKRLTGAHETASIDQFSWGVANRGASIRIPRTTEAEKKGYLEDRRPASNVDPYVLTAKVVETTCL